MEKIEFWIEDGCLVDTPDELRSLKQSQRVYIQSNSAVKVETGEEGTTVLWSMFASNWASLYFVQNWLHSLTGPFKLRFFNSGWFSEKYDTSRDASARIEWLITKSDVRFSARVFTKNFYPKVSNLPEVLRESWEAGQANLNNTVVCAVDVESGQTQVESVGNKSAIASIWGVSPVSFPCLTGHSYDRVVSGAYLDVIKTERPNYSHVVAAMTKPDGETRWYGYQRAIFPGKSKSGSFASVHIIGHVSPIDIPLL